MFKINKSPKRLVIVGSAGVGKTSLAESLKDVINLRLIPEQARIICNQDGYKNIYEIKNPNNFRFRVLREQIKREERLNNFISDRSTIDCWVHWIRWSWGISKTYESENYFKLAYKQALKYSHIIYIPRLIKPKEDGFRWNNEDYQNQVDRLLRETLLEWELVSKTLIIRSIILKERINEVKDFLSLS